jgi:glutamyl-tRNA synthetase
LPTPFFVQIVRGADGKAESIEAALNLAGDFKTTKSKVTWIADVPAGGDGGLSPVALRLHDFDYLISKPKLEESDDFEAVVNPVTKFETLALGEASMRNLQRGDIVQLERKAFYRVDEALANSAGSMLLFAIPDGKPRATGVSSSGGGPPSSSSKASEGGAGAPGSKVHAPSPLGKK